MKMIAVPTIAQFLLVCAVFAQSNTGRLVGAVSGPDGVIPGATVTVTDNQTGRVRTVTTSGEGAFTIPQLEVGTYTVKISANGFKTFTANDLKIDVGQEYSLRPSLEIGDTSDSITVTAGADLLNGANAELNTTISPQQIKDLPLDGRNPLDLIALQAGTSSNMAQNTSINGQRTSFTNITRDGINVNDNFIRQNAGDFSPERPSVDDTGEFTLTTQNGSAAQSGAAQVQLVTPRGQTEFHGALFYFNRNSALGANDFFNNAADIERPFLNRNQFGGTISGPAPLPRFGQGGPVFAKDKLFFFGSYEGLRLRTTSSPPRTRLILTPSARTGTFTFNDSTGARRSVNLFTLPVSPGAGSAPVPTGIDPIIQSRILDNMPAVGNRSDLGDGLNTTGLSLDQANDNDRDSFTTRVDVDINDRHTLNFVYSYKKGSLLRPDADGVNGFGAIPVIVQPDKNHFFVTAYRQTLGTSFTNEIRGGFFLSKPTFNRQQDAPAFLIGGAISPAPAANDPIAPLTAILNNPEVSFLDQGRDSNIYNIQDSADYQRGNHGFRFGFSANFYRVNPFNDVGTVPTVFLGTNPNTPQLTATSFASVLPPGASISSSNLATANALYSALGGIIGLSKQTFNVTDRDSGLVSGATNFQEFAWENYGFYLTDQWRAFPSLTLNLGLRYEYQTPLRNINGVFLEPVINGDPVRAILDPNGRYDFLGTNAGGSNFYKPDRNNFAPLFSFAYSPDIKNGFLSRILPDGGKTVIRGGFRMSYVNDETVTAPRNAGVGNVGLSATTISATQTFNNVSTSQLNARLNAPPINFNIPNVGPRSFADNNTAAFGNFGTVFGIDPNLQTPQTYEYNLSIQREFKGGVALEVRYVGNNGNNLIRAIDYNQIDIRSNGFLTDFLRARNNLLIAGNGNANASNNFNCSPNFAGCQPLQIIGTSALGTIPNATILNRLRSGQPADLGSDYVNGAQTRGFRFLPNPNTGVADLLENSGRYNYSSLQVEVRKRYSHGLYLQGNYTFQKVLTNAVGTSQARFDPVLDLLQPRLEYSRADFDTTHVFNFNAIYDLPFGKGRRFLNQGGAVDQVLGGWQLTTIVRVASGAPLTIIDPRGTLNRTGRSPRQTANSSLTKDQIKDLVSIHRTKCGIFIIDPRVIDINLNDCSGTGRAALGFGTAPFPGQVFFNVAPGETGNLERAFISGPLFSNVNASILKNFQITERVNFQFRAEAFNLFNRANFGVDNALAAPSPTNQVGILNINSTTFGRLTTTVAPNDTFRVLQFGARLQF